MKSGSINNKIRKTTTTKKKSNSVADNKSAARGKEKRAKMSKEAKKSEKRSKENKKEKKIAVEEKRKGASCSSSSSSTSWGAVATCSFPMSRVWRLVRGEGSHGSAIDTRTTNDAVFLINKAAEMFLEQLTQDAYANAKRNKSITYKNLSSTVYKKKRYEFLSDFVPEKVRVEDALKAKAE